MALRSGIELVARTPELAVTLWRRARKIQDNHHLTKLQTLAGMFPLRNPGQSLKYGSAAASKAVEIAAINPDAVAEKSLPALVKMMGTSDGLSEVAVGALVAFVSGNESRQRAAKVAGAGAIPKLIEVLGMEHQGTRKNALMVLMELAIDGHLGGDAVKQLEPPLVRLFWALLYLMLVVHHFLRERTGGGRAVH